MVGDRTDLGVGVQPEDVLGVGIIRELFSERLFFDFAGDLVLTHVSNHGAPVGTFLVKHCHLVIDFLVGNV